MDRDKLRSERRERRKLKRRSRGQEEEANFKKGVIYVGHIPHGFYEQELRRYFSQFGTVTRVKLARSRETGNPKGYAFVEFEYDEVAKIAAETMDNYLMFDKLLQCKFIPSHKVHPLTFKGWRKHPRRINRLNWSRLLHNRAMVRNKDKYQRVIGALIKKERRKRHRLKELGIDYDFPGYAAVLPKKSTRIKFSVSDEDD
ncbi:MKI67 FHA domain-interacting nucleolar phosphoprotein-like [Dysidea avara]|uniref:MKI67 FHA domain-interacting nucleolar phosphoprotein-like n=1 Tax=Dysidea avara TaxID=196820 RepID=UPI0033214968